jgi:hypothetical protein
MISKKECAVFQDLAKLVRETTWIESSLGSLGGDGAGIWEKFDSIRGKFPKSMEQRVINIATVRNNAVHGNPIIVDIDTILIECKSLTKIIQNRDILDKILQETTKIHNELKQANVSIDELNTETKTWLNKVASQRNYCESCEGDAIAQLLKEKESVFISIRTCINNKSKFTKIYNELQSELMILKESGQSLEDLSENFQEWKSNIDTQDRICTTEETKKFLREAYKHLSFLKRHLFFFKLKQFIFKKIKSYFIIFLIILAGLFYIGTFYGR